MLLYSYLNKGDISGKDWVPPECDVSIRKGWFWHKSQKPKPLSQLLDVYYNSVGRNCVLLFNVPPNSSGLISGPDIQRLTEFRKAIDTIFTVDLASGSSIEASSQRGGSDSSFGPNNVLDDDHLWSYWAPEDTKKKRSHWIELGREEGKEVRFNVVRIQEAIGLGQRIKRHEIYADGKKIVNATTVGFKRLHRLDWVVGARTVRIRVLDSRGVPLISSLGLHFDPYWVGKQ